MRRDGRREARRRSRRPCLKAADGWREGRRGVEDETERGGEGAEEGSDGTDAAGGCNGCAVVIGSACDARALGRSVEGMETTEGSPSWMLLLLLLLSCESRAPRDAAAVGVGAGMLLLLLLLLCGSRAPRDAAAVESGVEGSELKEGGETAAEGGAATWLEAEDAGCAGGWSEGSQRGSEESTDQRASSEKPAAFLESRKAGSRSAIQAFAELAAMDLAVSRRKGRQKGLRWRKITSRHAALALGSPNSLQNSS